MLRPERGQTPAGFRERLLHRIRNEAARQQVDPRRLQQRVAFERLLARLAGSDDWVLKGGFALQLRYGLLTRPTRDVDLRTMLPTDEALARLRRTVAASTLADNFTFVLGDVAKEMQGAPGGSLRVRVAARLAGVDFVVFHVDLPAATPSSTPRTSSAARTCWRSPASRPSSSQRTPSRSTSPRSCTRTRCRGTMRTPA